MEVASSLLAYRKKHRLYQKEMAARIGVTREYYWRLERGKGFPSRKLLTRICALTQTTATVAVLLADQEGMHVEAPDLCATCLSLKYRDRKMVASLLRRMSVKDGEKRG